MSKECLFSPFNDQGYSLPLTIRGSSRIILGPILFSLFINDLPLLLKQCQAGFFADDATAHTSIQNIEAIDTELQSDFSITVSRSKQNKLPINYNKTIYMILGSKKRAQDKHQLVFRAEQRTIDKVSTQRLISIFIDDYLSWTSHIDHLCSTLSSKISFSDKHQHTCFKKYKSCIIEVILGAMPGEQHQSQI